MRPGDGQAVSYTLAVADRGDILGGTLAASGALSDRAAEGTPPAWRLAAAGLLLGGLALGRRLAAAPSGRVLKLSAATASGAVILVLAGSRRMPPGTDLAQSQDCRLPRGDAPSPSSPMPERPSSPEPPPWPRPLPSLDVLIPARDEVQALPHLIADLAQQDHRDPDGRPRFRIVVIDDRSCDGTGEAARRAADRHGLGAALTVVRRRPGSRPDGKGAALAAVPNDRLRGDATVVLDADARVEPGFLRGVAAMVATGTAAVTLRRRIYHRGASLLAAAQAAELDLDALQLRARLGLGGAGELRGNGMVITPAILAGAGGWPCPSLTEDLDLSTRLAATGIRVGWEPRPVAWEAATATWHALARQRLRWAEGSLRRFLALLPGALASGSLSVPAKVDLAVYAAQAILPPVVLGAAIGGVRKGRPGGAIALLGSYVAAATTLGVVAATVDHEPELGIEEGSSAIAPPAVRGVLAGVFALHWLAIVPVALGRIALHRGPLGFDRTRDRLL